MPVLDHATVPAPAVHQYNKRVGPCPGSGESGGVMGYNSLGDLRSDVADYLASFYTETPTSSPTTTLTPTPGTLSPTMRPSRPPTPGPTSPPSAPPTLSPSEIPTKAPITPRPSPYPTGSIRQEKKPTWSPSPTIELHIIGGISIEEGPTGPAGPSGPSGPTDFVQEINFDGPTRRTAVPPARSTGLTSLSHEESWKGKRARGPGGWALRRLNGGITGDATDSMMEEVALMRANAEGDFSSGNDKGTNPLVQPKGEGGELDLVLGVIDISDPQEFQESYESALGEWFDSLEPPSKAAVPAVTFYICPNTRFRFDDSLDTDSPILHLETPLIYHPVEIRCLGDCYFIGGGWHIMLDHNLKFANKMDGGEVDEAHPITFSGITFQEAGRASILILDPVGAVIFENCKWLSNVEAVVVAGTYNATEHLTSSATESPTLEPTFAPARTTTSSTLDWSIMMTTSTSTFDHMASLTDDGFGHELDGIDDRGMSRGSGSKMMRTMTIPDSRFMFSEEEKGYFTSIDGAETDFEYEEEPFLGGMRLLAVETAPRSIVTIKNCSFSGNKGNSTIVVSSYSHELHLSDRDPGVLTDTDDTLNADNEGDGAKGGRISHSIHLSIEDTTFMDENMEASLIANYGGKVQLSRVVFMNNSAESMIISENGTLAMVSTEIKWNDVKGDVGAVVLYTGSVLEENEGNCATSSLYNGTAIESTAILQCEGIVLGRDCSLFDICPTSFTTTGYEITNTTTSNGQISPVLEDELEGCFKSWDDLSTAVHSRVMERQNFTICSGATLLATTPVVINSDYISIRCGTEQSPSRCTITGGVSHFHVTGSSKGVELERLIMKSSTGSSVMAIGTRDATLRLTDCEWSSNTGASAVLIHSNENLNTASNTLDIIPLLRDEVGNAAMSVEVSSCIFGGNEFNIGAIANFGGTLTIKTTSFVGNLGMGGDVLVANKGSLTVGHSCFNASSSTTPGVIFVQRGSQLVDNIDNFGFDVTAGVYSEGTCKDIFEEAEEVDCLGSATCSGRCAGFSAPKCMIMEGEENTMPGRPSAHLSGDEGAISVPHYPHREESGTSKIIPIVIGALVSLLIVLGLVCIYLRRRKAYKGESGSASMRVHVGEGMRKSEQRGGGIALEQGGVMDDDGIGGADFVKVSNSLGVVEDYGLEGADFVDVGNPPALDTPMT